jgi:U4/U6.U5 tri-snRNP-associated protein 2
VQDLFVERLNTELISTKESYIQVWERRRGKRKA